MPFKLLMLSDKHSDYNGKHLFIELQGGSPWFGYLWIDDVCYKVIKLKRSIKLKKVKL